MMAAERARDREGRSEGGWKGGGMAVPRSLGGDLAAQIGLANYLPRLCGGGVGSFSIMRSTTTPPVASEFFLSLSNQSRSTYSFSIILARSHRRSFFCPCIVVRCGRFVVGVGCLC